MGINGKTRRLAEYTAIAGWPQKTSHLIELVIIRIGEGPLSADKIRILIVDDEDITRQRLKAVLQSVEGFTVVGEASDGRIAVEKAAELKPDVVLMDISMPLLDGIAATQEIKKHWGDICVVMLTVHGDDERVFAAFGAGADGYCVKGAKASQLALAVRSVREGAAWLDPTIADCVLRAHPPRPSSRSPDGEQKPADTPLSPREVDVLRLVAAGRTNWEIGKHLHLSSETIKTNMRSIMHKLLVDDRTEAAVKALREGLI